MGGPSQANRTPDAQAIGAGVDPLGGQWATRCEANVKDFALATLREAAVQVARNRFGVQLIVVHIETGDDHHGLADTHRIIAHLGITEDTPALSVAIAAVWAGYAGEMPLGLAPRAMLSG